MDTGETAKSPLSLWMDTKRGHRSESRRKGGKESAKVPLFPKFKWKSLFNLPLKDTERNYQSLKHPIK